MFNYHNPGRWFGKPYFFFGDYLWDKYGTRVLKLPINAIYTCPNRDGTLSHEGCTFCSEDGSASPTCIGFSEIPMQMENAKNSFKRKDEKTRYIAYFQAFSNTYAPITRLRELYDAAVAVKDVSGLMIATRPDCLPDDILDLIASYKMDNFELWLEIGMQTMHEKSLNLLNRRHTHQDTRDSIFRAAEKGIPVCVHIILGVPQESWKDMMMTAKEISSLPVQGVKIHHFHIIKDTKIESDYNKGKVTPFSFREYVSYVCDFIERLRPNILIHRLHGDRSKESLIAPLWAMHKGTVLKAIEDEFHNRGSFQGFLYSFS